MNPGRNTYRVTIRHYARAQQYEVFEIEAADLRDAVAEAAERFPEAVTGSADLVEIRLANPADSGASEEESR